MTCALAEPVRIPSILDYKQELGLREEQQQAIRQALAEFQAGYRELAPRLQAAEDELQALMASRSDLPALKASLTRLFNVREEVAWVDITAVRKIEDALTPEQLTRWRALQAEKRK